MRLSERAKQYLDNNDITALLALPFSELVHASDVALYAEAIADPLEHLQGVFQTVDANLECPIINAAFNEAVVISSGQIYSREAIDGLLRNGRTLLCPMTRQPLRRIGGTYAIALPEVDNAVRNFRAERDRVRAEQERLAAEEAAAAQIPQPIAHLRSAQIYSAINNLADSNMTVHLCVVVSSNKFRMKIDTLPNRHFTQAEHRAIRTVFENLFYNKPESEIVSNGENPYHLEPQPFGRCWSLNASRIRFELWFPSRNPPRYGFGAYRLTDAETQNLLSYCLAPLELPADEVPVDLPEFSMRNVVESRTYFPIFNTLGSVGPVPLFKVLQSCVQFMAGTEEIAVQRRCSGLIFNDRVYRSTNALDGTNRVVHPTVFTFSRGAGTNVTATSVNTTMTTQSGYIG